MDLEVNLLLISAGTFWSLEDNLTGEGGQCLREPPQPRIGIQRALPTPLQSSRNMNTRLIDGAGSAVQRKRLSERGGDLDIFYRLMLPLGVAEDTGVRSRGRETQINTD